MTKYKALKGPLIILFISSSLLLCVEILRYAFINAHLDPEIIYVPKVGQTLSTLINLFPQIIPFSLGEAILYLHVIGLLVLILNIIRCLFAGKQILAIKQLVYLIAYSIFLYSSFFVLWGYNYYRQPISDRLSLPIQERHQDELITLARTLIVSAKSERENITANQLLNLSQKDLALEIKDLSWDFSGSSLGKSLGLYQTKLAPPKSVLASEGLSYLGITGIYFPFTGEANINTHVPGLLLAATMAHEIAHQRGIAPEDEANFVAYLVTQTSESSYIRYSGTMMALIYTMNAIYKVNPQAYTEIRLEYSEFMNEDLRTYSNYWKKYEGVASETHTKVNNAYLKFNQQTDGVASYGQMVDLLLAYRAQGQK